MLKWYMFDLLYISNALVQLGLYITLYHTHLAMKELVCGKTLVLFLVFDGEE